MRRHLLRTGLIILALAAPHAMAQGTAPEMVPEVERLIEGLDPASPVTRGIRVPAGQPADPARALTTTTAPPGAAAIALTVTFASGSAELAPAAIEVLDNLGKALGSARLAGYRFRVEGHTDTVGPAALNQALSERRATAVATWLTARYAIQPARLMAVGLGETELAVPTPDNTPEPRNRRVCVVNLGS